jgi:hypothetical protein
MHSAVTEAVIAEGLEGQGLKRRPLLGKHGGDLPLGGAMNPGVGPVRVPAIEVRLGGLERLEAQALERRALRVADARFHFAFAIGIADATRQRHRAVVGQHVPVERIERGIVDVRGEHAFFEVIEDDDAGGAAEPAKGALVQLTPDLRARVPSEQAHGFAGVGQGEDEEPRAAILARRGPPDHRAVAVVDLALFLMVSSP